MNSTVKLEYKHVLREAKMTISIIISTLHEENI